MTRQQRNRVNIMARRRRALRKRDAIAVQHLALVVHLAARIVQRLPASFELSDLIAVGNLALVKAAAKYNPAGFGGTPFRMYARAQIRGAMLDSVRRKNFVENTRPSIDDPGKERFRAEDVWLHENPSTEARHALALCAAQPVCEVHIDRARLNARVSAAISWLPDAEREVLSVLYSDAEPTVAQTAHILHIRQTRVIDLQARAIAALRRRLTGEPVGVFAESKAA